MVTCEPHKGAAGQSAELAHLAPCKKHAKHEPELPDQVAGPAGVAVWCTVLVTGVQGTARPPGEVRSGTVQ